MNIYRISQSEEKPIGSISINLKRYKTGQRCRNWYRVTDMVSQEGDFIKIDTLETIV